jgi:hypothetical protein
MNRVQTIIAQTTGIQDVLSSQEGRLVELQEANQQIIIDNALMQRAIEDINYLNLFEMGGVQDILPLNNRATLNRLRRMRHENPLAKQAALLCLRFTLGKGIEYTIAPEQAQDPTPTAGTPKAAEPAPKPDAKMPMEMPIPFRRPVAASVEAPDRLTEIFEAFWFDPDNQISLTSHKAMKKWLDHNYTDGERFLICFTSSAAPYVKLTHIPLEEIDLIIYHPDNRAVPLYYRRRWRDLKYDGDAWVPDGDVKTMYYLDCRVTDDQISTVGSRVAIKPSEKAPVDQRIYHSMPSPLETKKGERGISEFFASRNWFNVFKEFMEDRASINSAATSIAFKRKIKGGPTAVASFKNKLGDFTTGYDDNPGELKKLTRPAAAATYDSNPAVDLDWMKTDTGAMNAKEDARLILMGAGAGVATNITYFGEGGDANLATAQAMELPMVKSYEDWQEFVGESLKELTAFVLSQAITDPVEVHKSSSRIAFHFPPIITQDVVKHMTAWVQMVTSIAPGNRIVKKEAIRGALSVMGVTNIDRIMGEVMDEQERVDAEKQAQALALQAALQDRAPHPDGPPKPGIGDGSKDAPNFHSKPPIQGANSGDKRTANNRPPVDPVPSRRPA